MIFIDQHYYLVKIHDEYRVTVYKKDLSSYSTYSKGLKGLGYITLDDDKTTHASFIGNKPPDFIEVYGEIDAIHINTPIPQLHKLYPEYFI